MKQNIFSYKGEVYEHYFKVVIDTEIKFFECYITYNSMEEDSETLVEELKAKLTATQWNYIKASVQHTLNQQLKEEGKATGRFIKGENYVPKLLVKNCCFLSGPLRIQETKKICIMHC